jgi:uncharacterized membrane protein YeaQ/YmgE (transglycosylase-associated protein family)
MPIPSLPEKSGPTKISLPSSHGPTSAVCWAWKTLGQIEYTNHVTYSEEEAMHIVWWIIVGLIAGWLTGKVMRGAGYGVIGDIILGILGAIIGGFIMRQIGFAGQGGLIYTILVALGGAVVLTALVRAVKRV